MDAFTKIMQEYVDLGEIEGASARIVHKGKDLYRGCVGCSDVAARRPFGFDDIVCIFSLTKMVIGVAALKLWEQGGFRMGMTPCPTIFRRLETPQCTGRQKKGR